MAADKLTDALTNVRHASEQAGRAAIRRWLGKPGSLQRGLIGNLRDEAARAVAPVAGYLSDNEAVIEFALNFDGGRVLWKEDDTIVGPMQFQPQDQAAAGRAVGDLWAVVWATAEVIAEKLTEDIDPKAFTNWLALAQLLLCPFELNRSAAALVKDLYVVGVGEVNGEGIRPTRHSNHRIDNSMMVLLNAYRESLGLARIRQPTKKSTKARKASPGRVTPAAKVPTTTLTGPRFRQIRSMTPRDREALPAATLEMYKRQLKANNLS